MRDAIPTTLEGLSNVFLQDANRLQEELDRLSNGDRDAFIVTVATLPIRIQNDGSPAVSTLRSASIYLFVWCAQLAADRIYNGSGERGIVCTLQHAYITQIEHLRKLAADLIVEAHYQGV
jgi:hypothetical protein